MEVHINEQRHNLAVVVPMPDGTLESIKHLAADVAREMLGVWTCPSGKPETHINAMQTKAQEWLDRAKEGRPTRHDVWFLLD